MGRLLLTLALLSLPLAAQDADTATRQLIQKLLTRIDSLEKRVTELEAERAPRKPAPPAETPPPAAHAHDMPPQQAEAANPIYPLLKISGFSDLNLGAIDQRGVTGFGQQTLLAPRSGFQEGQFILHFSSALSPRVSFFGELSLTARPDAGTGTPAAAGFNPEVERAIIRFDQSDRLKISFGRYHTPINYWNTAFHHGTWLQTTISRPEMTQFGGSFIPVHFVGALAEGSFPAGGLNLNYNVALGNGRGSAINRGGDFGDVNNHRAALLNLFVRPDRPYGLQVGGSVYRDHVTPLTAPPAREWIQSAHVVWNKETPEFIAEFANIRHTPIAGGTSSNSQAFYAQTAYRLPVAQRLWKPYYRFEYTHIPRSDAIFRALPSFNASTVGIRYDLSTFAALKFEYRRYNRFNLPAINGAFSQVSFTF